MEPEDHRKSIETQTSFKTLTNPTKESLVTEKDKVKKCALKNKITEILRRLKILFINNLMLIFIIISAGFGIGLGFALRPYNLSTDAKLYFSFPGELFVRALRFITLPLFLCNLITGMSGLVNKTKRIALVAIAFFVFSLLSSLMIGFLFVLTIKPGNLIRDFSFKAENPFSNRIINTADVILDLLRNLIPDNIVKMTFQSHLTILKPIYINQTNQTINISNAVFDNYSRSTGSSEGTNLLGLLIFSLLFGNIIGKMGSPGKELHNFFETLSKAFLEIIRTVIWMSPIGVFSLLCSTILSLEKPESVFQTISLYVVTCLVGFLVQGVIVMPLIYFIFTRKNVFKLLKNVSEALLVAFATSSSLVTLPVTLKCVEQKHHVSKLISRPVLFVGTSIHFSGIPMYQLIGSLFIAQINNKVLSTSDYFLTAILTLIASLTVAGIPSGGLVTIILVLDGLGINQNQVGLIFTVDWFIDRFLTMVNVWANCIATDLIYNINKYAIEDGINSD